MFSAELYSSAEGDFIHPFFDLRQTIQSCVVLAFFSQLVWSRSDMLSHIITAGPSFPPKKIRSLRPAD